MGKELIDHIKKLLQRKQEIEAELAEAHALLNGARHGGPLAETKVPIPRLRLPPGPGRRRNSKPTAVLYKQDSSVGRAVEVLRDSGKPLHVNEIIARIEQLGYKVKKTTLVGMISVYVTRGLIFERVKPNTFGLIEWDKKEAKH